MAKQRPRYADFPEGTTVKQLMDWIRGNDVRSKTDLRDWTGCPPMHLNVEPVEGTKNEDDLLKTSV